MADGIITAGATISYAFETTSGVRPTEGYQKIPCIKSTPDLNPEPQSLEVTDLNDSTNKRYIPAIKDPGGNLGFTANNTNEFQAVWFAHCYLSDEAAADGLATWYEIKIPGLSKAFYFSGTPSLLGVAGMEVGAVAEVTADVSPSASDNWQDVSTNAAPYITPIQMQYVTSANSPLGVTVNVPTIGWDEVDGEATSSNESAATVSVTATGIEITKVAAGTTYITIGIADGDVTGRTVFEVSVT